MKIRSSFAVAVLCGSVLAGAQTAPVRVRVNFAERLGPLEIDRMALGQGGLSEEPMWQDRIAEIRALQPRLVRLFIQEDFDLLPERGRYHFDTLDRSVDTILATGARPLMCLCFKPSVLFPEINQDVVEPSDYEEWERLVFNLVRHYRDRGAGIRYWEISNEPDIGEDGGCPYRFKPDSYVRYYRHTVSAIGRADPEARVGGPALANAASPILPALMEFCETNQFPLHFVSWHIYSSDPKAIRGTIDSTKRLLARHPALKPETFLDEWNMSLGTPPSDPRLQPCFVAETIWQMKDAGLDYSCYYHIRYYHVSFDRFARIMSPAGTAFMTGWWNRMPQFDGLFDFQNTVRPAYFTFKLLSRLTGERLRLDSGSPSVHGFMARDDRYRSYTFNLMLWNFSASPAEVEVRLEGAPGDLTARPLVLDAASPANDENTRLRPENHFRLRQGEASFRVRFEPYGVRFWSFDPGK